MKIFVLFFLTVIGLSMSERPKNLCELCTSKGDVFYFMKGFSYGCANSSVFRTQKFIISYKVPEKCNGAEEILKRKGKMESSHEFFLPSQTLTTVNPTKSSKIKNEDVKSSIPAPSFTTQKSTTKLPELKTEKVKSVTPAPFFTAQKSTTKLPEIKTEQVKSVSPAQFFPTQNTTKSPEIHNTNVKFPISTTQNPLSISDAFNRKGRQNFSASPSRFTPTQEPLKNQNSPFPMITEELIMIQESSVTPTSRTKGTNNLRKAFQIPKSTVPSQPKSTTTTTLRPILKNLTKNQTIPSLKNRKRLTNDRFNRSNPNYMYEAYKVFYKCFFYALHLSNMDAKWSYLQKWNFCSPILRAAASSFGVDIDKLVNKEMQKIKFLGEDEVVKIAAKVFCQGFKIGMELMKTDPSIQLWLFSHPAHTASEFPCIAMKTFQHNLMKFII